MEARRVAGTLLPDLLEDPWLAELRVRYPELPAPTEDELSGKLRLFEAVARLLDALGQRAPLVLLLDDLHLLPSPHRSCSVFHPHAVYQQWCWRLSPVSQYTYYVSRGRTTIRCLCECFALLSEHI